MADIAKLKTLLATPHPVSGAWSEDDALAAAQFNAEDIEHVKDSLSGEQIFAVTNTAEFAGLTEHKQQLWLAFCARDSINPAGSANVALVQWVFGAGSNTLAALATARTELIGLASREGLGLVYPSHVTAARVYHG